MSGAFAALSARAAARGWPVVMGIVNVTPDSFSDGGVHTSAQAAVDAALRLHAEGADIIDVGGESTRPGAEPVSVEQEMARVMPVLEGIRARSDVTLSLDTSKPALMSAALALGVEIVNDVNALRAPGALDAIAAHRRACVVLMHMRGEPRSMQKSPHYDDVVTEVSDFLAARARTCLDAGIDRGRIMLDPGLGFGKTLGHNLTLLKNLSTILQLGYPVLIGASRKSMLSAITGRAVDDRTVGSVAVALRAAHDGASALRVHDVRETVDAFKVWSRVSRGE